MKYMTFRAACAYTGVANMLETFGIDATDRDIALGMNLPFLFAKEDGAYLAGPMLQTAKWFDLYLCTIGFSMHETFVEREKIPSALREQRCAMIGLHLTEEDKHAVVFTGYMNGEYLFINNKYENTDQPEQLYLEEKTLLRMLDEQTAVAHLQPAEIRQTDFRPLFHQSRTVLKQLKRDLDVFCQQVQTHEALMAAMNPLFRAVLLDGVTMLELIDQRKLAEKLIRVRESLMTLLKMKEPFVPEKHLHFAELMQAIDEYTELIPNER